MASRVTREVQPQPGGGGVVQKNAHKERRNRTALGDIGNVDAARHVDGKAKIQINRPVTRSFGAQLLENAQAAASQKNKHGELVMDLGVVAKPPGIGKKGVPVARIPNPKAEAAGKIKKEQGVDQDQGLHAKIPAPKAEAAGKIKQKEQGLEQGARKGAEATKRVAAEHKEDEERKPEEGRVIKLVTRNGGGEVKERSRKKTETTFTSVLAARSKEYSLGVRKSEDLIVDIDEASAGDELAVAEYADDIYKFYKHAEVGSQICDYMCKQPDINERMRSILVDWLIEVHHKFELRQETLYLTVNIIDRFLSVKAVPRKELQLVGISSMLIASKYEEIWAPQVNDFVCISDRAYVSEQVLAMEKVILGKLEWELTLPTAYMFLSRFVKASLPSDNEMENMVYFFAELGLMNYTTVASYCPSILAASSVYAARCTLEKSPTWTETLKHYTGYCKEQLKDCAKLLVSFHLMAPDNKLKAVYRKFSKPDLGAVALRTPAGLLA